MPDLLIPFLYGTALTALWQWQLSRRDRELRYLRTLAGSKNLWHVRCTVCLKPLRDRPTGSDTTLNEGGSKTSISYHLYGGCAEIVRDRETRPTT